MSTIKIRRGTQAELDAVTLAAGELGFTTDTEKVYIGDGTSNLIANEAVFDLKLGFGISYRIVDTEDLDTYFDDGLYTWVGTTPTNAPVVDGDARYATMLISNDAGRPQQIVFGAYGDMRIWGRRYNSGVWSSWVECGQAYVDDLISSNDATRSLMDGRYTVFRTLSDPDLADIYNGISANYVSAGSTKNPDGGGTIAYNMLTESYNASWANQFAMEYYTNNIWYRIEENDVWGSWVQVLTSENGIFKDGTTDNGLIDIDTYDADFIVQDSSNGTPAFIWRDASADRLYLGTGHATPTLRANLLPNATKTYDIGSYAYRFDQIYADAYSIMDSRGLGAAADMIPSEYDEYSVTFTFDSGFPDTDNDYDSAITVKGWATTGAYRVWQLLSSADNVENAAAGPNLFFRASTDQADTWGDMQKVLTDKNHEVYELTATDPDGYTHGTTILTNHANTPGTQLGNSYWYIETHEYNSVAQLIQTARSYAVTGGEKCLQYIRSCYSSVWTNWTLVGNAFVVINNTATDDPDDFESGLRLTNHANSPDSGEHWFTTTREWGNSDIKVQEALEYNETQPRYFIRGNVTDGDTWSSWREMVSFKIGDNGDIGASGDPDTMEAGTALSDHADMPLTSVHFYTQTMQWKDLNYKGQIALEYNNTDNPSMYFRSSNSSNVFSDWVNIRTDKNYGEMVVLSKSDTVAQDCGGADGTETTITWDGQEIIDDLYTHSTTVNSSRITVGEDGRYRIRAVVGMEVSSGRVTVRSKFEVNGTTDYHRGTVRNYSRGSSNGNCSASQECVLDLDADDYVEFAVIVDSIDTSTDSLDTDGTEVNAGEHTFEITRVG